MLCFLMHLHAWVFSLCRDFASYSSTCHVCLAFFDSASDVYRTWAPSKKYTWGLERFWAWHVCDVYSPPRPNVHFPAAWSGFQGCSMVFVSRELQKPRVARYGEWGWMMAIEAHGALGPCSAHAAAFHRCESQMFEREAPNHTEPNTAHTQAHTHAYTEGEQ